MDKLVNKRLSLQALMRWGLLVVLVTSLLALGNYEGPLKEELTYSLNKIGELHGVEVYLSVIDTTDSTPLVNLLYRLLYTGLCILIIKIIYRSSTFTIPAIGLYSILIFITLLLYGVAEMLELPPLRNVAFKIDTFAVSPIPAMLVISALRLDSKHKKA